MSRSAYLVLRSSGRWTDVFRLSPPTLGPDLSSGQGEAILGRSSACQIVLRSEKASRQHARIFWDSGDRDGEGSGWMIEDLGSRNGTRVHGRPIDRPTALEETAEIEVAGFNIQFTHRIESSAPLPSERHGQDRASDDQITMDFDPASITDQRSHSRYLSPSDLPPDGAAAAGLSSNRLLQMAFRVARAEDQQQLVEQTLQTLDEQLNFESAGIYLGSPAPALPADFPLVGIRQKGSRSYRRPPETLFNTVGQADGQATLARNVRGDSTLAIENSQGEMDVESLILAPVIDNEKQVLGFLHLTTTASQSPLSADDLEFVVAVTQILAESIRGLANRSQLSESLDRSRKRVEMLEQQVREKVQLIGRSAAISEVIDQVALAAPTTATVLVRGESGVGKELVAAAIHHASPRRDGPLVCLNCAALSPTLLESELFGHEKGAFTGATNQKAGKFEAADTGTLMLDEIGEMDADIQAKFLRVIEGHPFERVGGHESIRVDVRVVAATNRDLQAMVEAGKFRQDLYYRLNVVEIVIPPLRSRGDDVILIAETFLERFNRETGRKLGGFTDEARKRLLDYSWPGNVRELRNVIERAVVLNQSDMIAAGDLAISGPAGPSGAPAKAAATPEATAPPSLSSSSLQASQLDMTLAQLERLHIERVLRHTQGNKSQAAKRLGIERSTLDRKMKRWAS